MPTGFSGFLRFGANRFDECKMRKKINGTRQITSIGANKMKKSVLITILVTAFVFTSQVFETKAAPGDYDPSFGIGGVSEHPISEEARMYRIALQRDGKILVAGFKPHGQTYLLILRRHNADGSLDTSFGYQGEALEQLTPNTYRYVQSTASEIAIQSDGRILIGGGRYADNGGFLGLAVWRFTSAGLLDKTFDGDGRQDVSTSTSNPNAYVDKVILTKSAVLGAETTKILALCVFGSGSYPFQYRSQIFRLNINGGFDTGFGIGGKISLGGKFNDIEVYKPALSTTGDSIYVAGADETATPTLWRLNANGSPDANFAASGKLVLNIGQLVSRHLKKVVVQPDGKILISGRNSNNFTAYNTYLLRLRPDGTPDPQFGFDILPNTNITGVYDSGDPGDLGIQSDGKIIASRHSSFTRFLPDGTGDSSFYLPYGYLTSFVIQRDDKLVSLFKESFEGNYKLRRTLPN